jgi:hypothetical protein
MGEEDQPGPNEDPPGGCSQEGLHVGMRRKK